MSGSKVLVFDIIGQMAHFRTYYTNSSSISYGFPPRTVVIGIIAAILGYKRDSYYEIFSPENCSLSVALLTSIRKKIYTLSYIRSKRGDKLSIDTYLKRKLNTYHISVEFVFPIKDEQIKYRIYVTLRDIDVYERLKNKLEQNKSFYSIYLGISELLAEFEYIGEFDVEKPIEGRGVSSVIPEESFHLIDFGGELSLALEKMPMNFLMDGKIRKIISTKKFVYERNAREIPVKRYDNVFSIHGKNLIWME